MKTIRYIFLTLGLLSCLSSWNCGQDADAKLKAFFEQYLDKACKQRPFHAAQWGDHCYDDGLEVLSADARTTGAELDCPMPAIIPAPVSLETCEGQFKLDEKTTIVATGGTETEAERFASALRVSTGLMLPVSKDKNYTDYIVFELDQSLKSSLGNEGYRLVVEPDRVVIRAAAEAGLFFGGITFQQLLPAEIFGKSAATNVVWAVPCVKIVDSPRFPWRGMLLDVARHFCPIEFVKKFVDLMAIHKLNTLHLHLVDDQGWRIEIKKYPRLTEIGSIRAESPKKNDRNHGDGTPYGPFFYTQEEIRDLVAYAEKKHITIVPEIEMPGHMLAALSAYPEFSCRGGPFKPRTRWGVEDDILCVGNEKSIGFMQDILSEVLPLFPSRYIHIGGDEAPRTRWKACPKCQTLLKKEGLTNEAQLQTWFNRRIEDYLAAQGRHLIGWDEILEGGLTPRAAVMSWRGMEGGLAAAKAGHDVVMTPTSHCYFWDGQAYGPDEPESCGIITPLSVVYSFDPAPASLPENIRKHILGTQGNMWGEYLHSPDLVEYFAFPRAAALAEVAWSPTQGRNFENFHGRLERHQKRLDQFPVHYRKLDPLPLGKWDPKTIPFDSKAARDFTIPANRLPQAGKYEVRVQYLRGAHGMNFDGAELLTDGQSVAKDGHRCFTGAWQVNPIFILEVPETSAGKQNQLRLHFDTTKGMDSWGEILWRRKK